MYISRPGESDLPIGSFLGELTDEIEEAYGPGSFIIEWVSAGPKQYSAKIAVGGDINNIVVMTKLRGITINASCSEIITFENMKAMVLEDAKPIKVSIPAQIARLPGWRIITRPATKIWQPVITKRFRVDKCNTIPLGYISDEEGG